MSAPETPRSGELIFLTGPSWAPAALAVGIALAVVGAFAGWVYSAIGGLIALVALWLWVSATGRELSRLPRRQRVTTAVLPAVTVRRARRD